MDGLVNLLRSLGSARVVVMGAVAAALIGFFAFLTLQITQPPMSLLYSGLDIKDSGAITEKLSGMGVEYQVSPDGTSIMVPEGESARLRMAMAQDGLPSGGNIGYEIFDNSSSLGTTSFVQNINHLRALEGELARSIQSIDRVAAARVHLVLPERKLFARDEQQPSASIVVRSQGRLGGGQVSSIQHLVAAAVPGLEPGRISIVDERGTLLAAGVDRNASEVFSSNADERRIAYESQLKSELEALLGNSLGAGKVRAEVMAEIDFDRVTTNSETYDPDSQVVRSSQIVEETGNNTERENSGASVANNLPEADIAQETGPTNTSSNARTEETVNYEISKTVRTEIQEAGRIKKLSVAILVDGRYTENEDGTTTYEPRAQEELDKIGTLVRSAIGFDEARGDIVNVVNMQFADVEPIESAAPEANDIFGVKRADFFRLAQLVVMAVVAALVILLVVRPLLVRMLESLPPPQPAGRPAGALPGGGQAPALAGMGGMGGQLAYHGNEQEYGEGGSLVPAGGMGAPEMGGGGSSFDLSQIDGQMQENAINKIGEVVTRHPDEAASIIRNWLYNG